MRKWNLLLVGLLAASRALAWGAYGHEQVNEAAVVLVKNMPVGVFLERSVDAVERLAITPDCEWKAQRGCDLPESEHLRELVFKADRFEHPLHYFEPDAFIRNGKVTPASLSMLPTGKYTDVVSRYVELLGANLEYVLGFPSGSHFANGNQPSVKDAAKDGTAPWRVAQLYDLAVDALAQEKYSLALVYLGTMGHYVGDMSQPLHTTMDFDGEVHNEGLKGLHSFFETKMLNVRAKKAAGAEQDPETKLFDSFQGTESAVVAAGRTELQGAGTATIARDEIVSSVMSLAGSAYTYLEKLMDRYAEVKEEDGPPSQPERFMSATLDDGISVLTLAENRMGASAALLARLWTSAYEAAKARNPSLDLAHAPRVHFTRKLAIESYPVPDYLPPSLLEGGPRDGDDE